MAFAALSVDSAFVGFAPGPQAGPRVAAHRGAFSAIAHGQSATTGLGAAPALAVALSAAAAAFTAHAGRKRSRATARAQGPTAAAGAGCARRGSVLLSFAAAGLALGGGGKKALAAEKVTADAVGKARADLAKLIKADVDKGPTLVRLAWHSSGTYEKMSKTGGSGQGTIRFREELAHGGNAGLDKAVAWLEPLKEANPSISYADLYTLGGVVAIRTLGGPEVPWRAGRVDSMSPSDVTPDGRLPGADNGSYEKDTGHLRDVFYRMGFDDQEIVALSGAHALGRCHADASGFVGKWTPTPTTFNNLYFVVLKNLAWEEGCVKGETCKNHQYRDVEQQQLMMLPTDIALTKDKSFMKWVDKYAGDQQAFFVDFSKAFSKLLENGTKDLYTV
mmetsp:Transcript_18555/g.48156  ORF Transcript_18555/g.48156 Transcript_18555/m.48156 type:complete len:390 (+) Transcript_18555:60-1229(+)